MDTFHPLFFSIFTELFLSTFVIIIKLMIEDAMRLQSTGDILTK